MKKIRCKFLCNAIVRDEQNKQTNVNLMPVTTGSKENKSFAKYTPSGLLELWISDKTAAAGFFVKGKEYYLDIIDPDSVYKPKPPVKKEIEEKVFKTLAMINGTISRPEISAENIEVATKKFYETYPGAVLHEIQ